MRRRPGTMNEKALRYIMRRDFSDGQTPTCLLCKGPLNLKEGHRISARKKVVLDHLNNRPRELAVDFVAENP